MYFRLEHIYYKNYMNKNYKKYEYTSFYNFHISFKYLKKPCLKYNYE